MTSPTTRPKLRRIGGRAGTTLGLVSLLIVLTAAPAVAAPPPATAHAANLSLLGITIIDTGTCNAAGTAPCTTSSPLAALPGQTAVTAGVIAQVVGPTNPTGASDSACAGLVGAGGAIQIGTTTPCNVTQGAPAGVTIGGSLGITGFTGTLLAANAVTAFCTTNATTGAVTGGSQLVNLSIGGGTVLNTSDPTLPTGALPTTFALLGATLAINQQTTLINGNKQFTALDLNIPNIAHLTIGQVSCPVGPFTVSVLPAKGLPIAGAMLLGFGGAAWFWRRRWFPGLRKAVSA